MPPAVPRLRLTDESKDARACWHPTQRDPCASIRAERGTLSNTSTSRRILPLGLGELAADPEPAKLAAVSDMRLVPSSTSFMSSN
eukprot:CAMPEP_0206126550 /NCGR_PEP_ID=MMETSP1472-20131121/22735_1 /ASSEMBLY_ACC=CAM_ASM_001108 /TAXON_ID=41880 /ORGANISM="Pycnococcus provasolii, Strain RCC251" /LENGTH=84 /DNA_ID=CAMNT_0053517569 /DNA_START=976 /DNA_END=1227 /DNA_ORIENTATION=+